MCNELADQDRVPKPGEDFWECPKCGASTDTWQKECWCCGYEPINHAIDDCLPEAEDERP